MNKLYLILLLLVGCGVESEDYPDLEWSGNITEQSERFILSYDDKLFDWSQMDKIEQWWVEVQECTGISIDISNNPLTIEYVDPATIDDNGRIIFEDSFTYIQHQDLIMGETTRHEMIHWLQYVIGIDNKENIGHDSDWFTDCL